MFKKGKDKEMDITSLNQILRTGKKILNIGYFMAIVCLILLGTYLMKEWNVLKYIKEFLILISPLFIGFLIAWLFDPFVSFLQEKNVPRVVGCVFVYVILIGFIFLICYLFVPSLVSQLKDFVATIPDTFDNITDFVIGFIQNFDSGHLINTSSLKKDITMKITEFGKDLGNDLPGNLITIGKTIVSGGLNFFLGLMVGFYLLFDFNKINKSISRFIPTEWHKDYKELITRINTSLRSYIQGVLIVMVLVFITQSIGLTIAGIEAPIVFALFCAVTDIIPYFGPYIGAIPAIIVGFTTSPITGLCVLVSILVVQLLENNFYQPLIMGHTMKLHPVTIMLGLLIFEHFFGILGMIIATPCIACLKVVFSFIIERTKYAHYFNLKSKYKEDNDKKTPVKAT